MLHTFLPSIISALCGGPVAALRRAAYLLLLLALCSCGQTGALYLPAAEAPPASTKQSPEDDDSRKRREASGQPAIRSNTADTDAATASDAARTQP